MSSKGPEFKKLGPNNYPQWCGEMEAWLRANQLWRLVSGASLKPNCPADASEALQTKAEDWENKSDKASGWLYLMVEEDQRVHFKGIKDDPVAIWKKLESIHMVKRAGVRFNAYDDLFSIRKKEDESLQSLTNRIDSAVLTIQNLRPKDFTLAKLDEELLSMTMIRALPDDYDNFVSSVLLLDKLDKEVIIQAFQTEETQRKRRSDAESTTPSAKALAAITPTPHNHSHNHSNTEKCDFCGRNGHTQAKCWKFEKAQKEARKPRPKQNANAAKESNPDPNTVKEYAGKASFKTTTPSQLSTNDDWTADTGATSHMTPHKHWLKNYQPFCVPIKLADNTIVYSEGVGNVVFEPVIGNKAWQSVEFTRVLHVPQLGNNLLAVLFLTKQRGFHVHIDRDCMNFYQNKEKRFVAPINDNNAAFLAGTTQSVLVLSKFDVANVSSTLPLDYSLWHRRFAHQNLADVKVLINKDWVIGVELNSKNAPDPICEPCLAGKMHANPFPTSNHRAKQPLELVHSDISGPTPVKSHQGYRYWILFLDDATRLRVRIPMRKKSDAFACFLQFKAFAERLFGTLLKMLREDKGGEYMGDNFNQYCINNGIERQHTVRNRPQQNGDAERDNRVAGERVTAMLAEANLPPQFWFEALAAYTLVQNRCPTSALKNMTPYECAYKRKPNVSNLRVWGCTAYVHIQKDKRKKFEPRMEKCIFIGYPDGYKGWKFYNPVTKKTVISERAEFDERFFPGLRKTTIAMPPDTYQPPTVPSFVDLHENSDPPEATIVELPDLGGDDDDDQAPPPPQIPNPPAIPQVIPQSPKTPPPRPVPNTPPLALRRQPRVRNAPGEWWKVRQPTPAIPEDSSDSEPEQEIPVVEESSDDELDLFKQHSDSAMEIEYAHCTHVANVADGSELRSWADAMRTPNAEQWRKAGEEEYAAHLQNGTWEIVKLPPGKKPIGCRWVWLIKRNADGSIERFKGRLVAQGFSQKPGLDYVEIFAPTFRSASMRLIIAIAAIQDLHLHSVDISHAFTNGDLDEEIYMKQPEGFHQGDANDVCLLKKSLYGLKQSARQWNKKIHGTLETIGFKRLESDQSIYLYCKDGVRIIMPIYVDDITLVSDSQETINTVIKQLSSHFKLRDLGPTSYLLGVGITRNRSLHSISLSQRQYIVDVLDRFGCADCKPVSTPMEPGLHLTKSMGATTSEEIAEMKKIPYLNAVGALMYLATTTRPDISYTVGVLARFNSNPGMSHWKAVKHLFRYLQGTKDKKLVYRPDDSQELFTSFTDADHGGCKDSGRSTGGYVIKFGSGAVSWSSKLQPLVALSTTEAEYIAAVEAGKEIIWMRQLLAEFGFTVEKPSILRIDNQSAISVSKNPEHHGRMKHLDLRFYWLRDQVTLGVITPHFVSTEDMPADLLTKSLAKVKVDRFRKMMGLED